MAELAQRQARIRQVVELTFGLRLGYRALVPAPLYHSAPSTYLQNALQMAERVVLMARFDAEELLSEMLKGALKMDATHVPYNGSAPAARSTPSPWWRSRRVAMRN